jgi:hypothetical protein
MTWKDCRRNFEGRGLRCCFGMFVRDRGTPQKSSFRIAVSAKIRLATFRINVRSVYSGSQLLANNLCSYTCFWNVEHERKG